MYCTSCGKPIPDTAAFCPECGVRNVVYFARKAEESAPAPAAVSAPVPVRQQPAAVPASRPVRTAQAQPAAKSAAGTVRLILGIVTIITAAAYLIRTIGFSDLEALKSLLRGKLSIFASGGEAFGGLLLASGIVSLTGRQGKATGITAACLYFTTSLVGWAVGSGIGAEKIFGVVAGLFGTAVLILTLVGSGKDK